MATQELAVPLLRSRKRRKPPGGPPGLGIAIAQMLFASLGIMSDNDVGAYSMLGIVTAYGLWYEARNLRGLMMALNLVLLACAGLMLMIRAVETALGLR